MKEKEVLKIFQKCGGMLKGHFLLSSGLHSPDYLQVAKVFQYPEYATLLSRELALRFKKEKIDLVIGPAIGGILLSFEMGKILKVKTIFAEREEGKMRLRRGFSIQKGEKCLVVEDVITTGASTKEVIDLVKRSKADVVGIAAIIERSKEPIDFKARKEVLLRIPLITYSEKNCPLCKKKAPLIKPGSRTIL
ncbi:MAG: orotate phosphoribosyltransferase [Candidatus Omnitrophica bacterium CG1_02_41_171]|nr:MAG: orotate phosphoribosyltransferase [Candidatus Omnitrophica bacterium CG1_02_41_171]PIW73908.1 MAG: orotate phosphoribosyltransferase [bacterium (Candidatus Ratteibacteria) CG_4_8_14_3_um_filter_41_36]HCG77571.1 orotate phosphoribosyltransferase [bacterium]